MRTEPVKPKAILLPYCYWEHHGGYIVELLPDVTRTNIPSSVKVTGNTLQVSQGLFKQSISMDSIDFESKGQPFSFKYQDIKAIYKNDGLLLWENSDFQQLSSHSN